MQKRQIETAIERSTFKESNYFLGMISMLLALVLLWAVWGLGGAQFFADFLCRSKATCDQIPTLGAIGDIFGGVNALFAAIALTGVVVSTDMTRRAFKEERQWSRDEKFVDQVKMSYEWAFNVLTDNGQRIPPRPDRINWLTCARHLERAKRIAALISTPALAAVLAEHEEFWRHRFYTALDSPVFLNWKYYATKDFSGPYVENIEITSAMIIVDFSNWRKGSIDPTDDVDRDKLSKEGNPFHGSAGSGLEAYVEQVTKNVEDLIRKRSATE